MDRRSLLRIAGAGIVTAVTARVLAPSSAYAVTPAAKQLSFVNTHTGETFRGAYWENGAFVPQALSEIERVLRDHRTNERHGIDPALLDQLTDLYGTLGARQPYQIISGYRSPATNANLHSQSSGVATRSLHMDGRAIDIRIAGIDTARIRDAALAAQRGGVGYYSSSDFVHVDTGRVRRW